MKINKQVLAMMPLRSIILGIAMLVVGLTTTVASGQGHAHWQGYPNGNHAGNGNHVGHGGYYGDGGHYGQDHHHHGYAGHGGHWYGPAYPNYSGYPYSSGFSLSIGTPYFGLGVSSPYDSYRYQSDYFDYRRDYYDRLLDSYRRDLQLNLQYPYSRYPDSPYRYGSYGSYGRSVTNLGLPSDLLYPPVATIDPWDHSNPSIVTPPNGRSAIASRLPIVGDDLADDAVPGALREAAHRLSESLSRRPQDADVWLGYLAPDRIVAALDSDSSPKRLTDLLRSYDGVTANPSLAWLVGTDGFDATRRLLRRWIESSAMPAQPPTNPPAAGTQAPLRSAAPPPAAPPPAAPPPAALTPAAPPAREPEQLKASPPSPPQAEPLGSLQRPMRALL